jgi:hypothetical protein
MSRLSWHRITVMHMKSRLAVQQTACCVQHKQRQGFATLAGQDAAATTAAPHARCILGSQLRYRVTTCSQGNQSDNASP